MRGLFFLPLRHLEYRESLSCYFTRMAAIVGLSGEMLLFPTEALMEHPEHREAQRITKQSTPAYFANTADGFFYFCLPPSLIELEGQSSNLHSFTLTPLHQFIDHRLISFSELHHYTVATSFYVVTLSPRSIHFRIT
jgi:hypothetical protein